MMAALAAMPAELAGSFQPATLTSRIVDGASQLDAFLFNALQALAQGIFMVMIGTLLFELDRSLAWIAVLAIIPSTVVSMTVFQSTRKWWQKTWRTTMTLRSEVAEFTQHRDVMQFFVGSQQVRDRLWKRVEDTFGATWKAATKGPVYFAIINAVVGSVVPLLWFIAALQVMDGQVRLAVVVVFMAYVAQLYTPITSLGMSLQQASRSLVAGMDLFALQDLLDRPSTDSVPRDHRGPPSVLPPAVAVRNMSYSYVAARPLLREVNFEVRPGEWTAIVGATGAGKTTLGRVIVGILTPQEGTVEVYGDLVSNIPASQRASVIGYVPQEPGLIQGTVADNITLGWTDVSREHVIAAAEVAQAHQFIRDLTDAYDTRLGTLGTGLSGGQRQRLAIARAVLRGPRLLVLDEATASLDSNTESRLLDNLKAHLTTTTLLLITHRLSTISMADQVIVMDGGAICERGSFDDLMLGKGILSRLVETASVAM
jgi:ATP-binding cassette subfamily B protein